MKTSYLLYGKGKQYRVLRLFHNTGDMCRSYGQANAYDVDEMARRMHLQEATRVLLVSNGRDQWIQDFSKVSRDMIIERFKKSAEKSGFVKIGAFDTD